MKKIPFTYIRGGTSRAVFFNKKDMPEDTALWHRIFRQVLGLYPEGVNKTMGPHLPTRKVAVISPAVREGADVDYHFFQMNERTGEGDDRGGCGNMSSAVGAYVVNTGMVKAAEGVNTVRIHSVNTDRIINARFEVKNGRALTKGDTAIHGVPGTGAPVELDFLLPGGGYSGKLFPTGQKTEVMHLPHAGEVRVTIIDCANPVVILSAEDIGLFSAEISGMDPFLEDIRFARSVAAERLGLVHDWREADRTSTYIPHAAIVAAPCGYRTLDGHKVSAEEMDICCRAVFQSLHPSYPAAASIATAAAAKIPGTLAYDVCRKSTSVIIGHPSGTLRVGIKLEGEEVLSGTITRTACHLFDGEFYIEQE